MNHKVRIKTLAAFLLFATAAVPGVVGALGLGGGPYGITLEGSVLNNGDFDFEVKDGVVNFDGNLELVPNVANVPDPGFGFNPGNDIIAVEEVATVNSSGVADVQVTLHGQLAGESFPAAAPLFGNPLEPGTSVLLTFTELFSDSAVLTEFGFFSGGDSANPITPLFADTGAPSLLTFEFASADLTSVQRLDFETSVVPIPAAFPLLASALAGLAFLARRRG